MYRSIVLLIMVVALTACLGPTQFVNPNGSPQSFEVDKQECLYQAQLHQPQNPELWPMTVRSCLATKGWRPMSVRRANKRWSQA